MRRNFNPYTDIDWDAPEFSVTQNDPRWVLTAADPVGRHPWYGAQPPQKQIAIGMWRQANVAKVAVHLESILIRGLMHYTFWVPNGSPEYRYCLHESVEECNHTMMLGNGEPHRGERSRRDAVAALGVAGVPALSRPGADRPHAEERFARGQVTASDRGEGDGDPRR
ncbi:MAG: rane protein [Mycobacterium sp.]|nr:rane protein [Mycobacterium sp.]